MEKKENIEELKSFLVQMCQTPQQYSWGHFKSVIKNSELRLHSVNPNEEFSTTLLHIACRHNNEKAVKLLLEANKEDLENIATCAGKKPETPLEIAVSKGNVPIALLLIEAGAKIDRRNRPSVLFEARNKVEITRLLLQHGADPNREIASKVTPLMMHVDAGSIETCRLLLEKGANPLAKDRHDNGIIHYWATSSCVCDQSINDATRLLNLITNAIKEADPTENPLEVKKYPEGYTPLHTCSCFGNLTAASILLGAGANVNERTTAGYTPLHLACIESNIKMTEKLLSAGANPLLKDMQDKLPKEINSDPPFVIHEMLEKSELIWKKKIVASIIKKQKNEMESIEL